MDDPYELPLSQKTLRSALQRHELQGYDTKCQCLDCLWARKMLELLPESDDVTAA